jgi:hypothetical protein
MALDRKLFAYAGGKALLQLDTIGDGHDREKGERDREKGGRDRDQGGREGSQPPDRSRGGSDRGERGRSKSPPPDSRRSGLDRESGGLDRGNSRPPDSRSASGVILELGRKVRVQYHLYYDVVGKITKLETRSDTRYVSILVKKCYQPGTTIDCTHDDTKIVMQKVVTWTSDQIARNEI